MSEKHVLLGNKFNENFSHYEKLDKKGMATLVRSLKQSCLILQKNQRKFKPIQCDTMTHHHYRYQREKIIVVNEFAAIKQCL